MLGCIAAVTETESPSQLRPAVIQRIWTSLTAGGRCVDLPYGGASGDIRVLLSASVWAPLTGSSTGTARASISTPTFEDEAISQSEVPSPPRVGSRST